MPGLTVGPERPYPALHHPCGSCPEAPEGGTGARSGGLKPLAQPRWSPEQPLWEDHRVLSPLPRDAGPSSDCRTPQTSAEAQRAEMTTGSDTDGKRPGWAGGRPLGA